MLFGQEKSLRQVCGEDVLTVVSQKLVFKISPRSRRPVEADEHKLEKLSQD